MTVTFAVGLKGKTEKPYGPGAKIVEGAITGGSGAAGHSIDAGDIDLKTIYSLYAHGAADVEFCVHVGTFTAGGVANNYATIAAHVIGGTTTALMGTYRILAIGE